MKRIIKATNILLVTLMLLTQTIFAVHAKSEKNKKPDPAFKDKASHIETSRQPYYGGAAVVDIYELDGIYYSVDADTGEVTEIIPNVIDYETTATYTEAELRGKAEEIVSQFFGERVDLSQLTFSLGQKIGTYFFRWEDNVKKLEDGSPAFIQVGLSQNGDFLNLFNTLPFGHGILKAHPSITKMPSFIGPFNEIYANRTANTTSTYWIASGTMTSTTGGYFYLYPASYCTAGYCNTFLYTTQSSSGSSAATWLPNANTNTKASVFIPSTHATATVTYKITKNDGTTTNSSVDQNAFYNSWVSITLSTISNGIKKVALNNLGTSGLQVAWDEVWVYNP